MTGTFRGDDPAGALRAGLLLLVVVGVVGTAVSLAYERHWASAWQWAPWITLGVITLATVALIVRRTGATVWLARAAAVLAIVSSVLGVWQHVDANLDPNHDHGVHGNTTATSAGGTEGEAAAGGSQHGDDTTTTSSNHHGDDKTATTSSNHHGDDEATASPDRPANDDVEPSETSMAEVLTGSAGSVPVPAALAIAPVGLALALATIGLGGRRSAPPP